MAVGNLLTLWLLAIAAHVETAPICWDNYMQAVSRSNLRSLVENPHGEHRCGPGQHPEAIIPDLKKPDPPVKFNQSDIAFVYADRTRFRGSEASAFSLDDRTGRPQISAADHRCNARFRMVPAASPTHTE